MLGLFYPNKSFFPLCIRERYLQQQVPPAVLLVRGDGDVQGVSVRQAVALVDEPSGKVKEVSSF